MLNISSFIAAFTSICWFIMSLKYTNIPTALSTNNTEALFHALIICFLPIITIWVILSLIKNSYTSRHNTALIYRTLEQVKKNSEYASSLGLALLNAETEIKNSFILQEFNLIISDINELLADIIKRSNSISSAQMEHLWSRTAGGERWLIAKTFIETHNFQAGFAQHLQNKALKDKLLKGGILEFYTRYQNLCTLLDSADKQKFFYNMVEYGALGKVFRIITPIAHFLSTESEPAATIKTQTTNTKPTTTDFSLEEENITFPSFLSENKENTPRLSEKKPENPTIDDGLKAIREEILAPSLKAEPEIPLAPVIPQFDNTKAAIQTLKNSAPYKEQAQTKTEPRKVISLDELEKEINASPENNYDEYAYPFGAWLNDKNNK